jgi:hypothetical protein
MDFCFWRSSGCRGLFFSSEAPAWSLLAQLREGEGALSLFPPPLCFGGPGVPPPAAAEVSTGLPPVTSEKTPVAALGRPMKHNAEKHGKNGETSEQFLLTKLPAIL